MIQYSSNKPNSATDNYWQTEGTKTYFWVLLPARNCLFFPAVWFSCFLSPRLVN